MHHYIVVSQQGRPIICKPFEEPSDVGKVLDINSLKK